MCKVLKDLGIREQFQKLPQIHRWKQRQSIDVSNYNYNSSEYMFINYMYKIKRPELWMNERSSLGLPPHWVLRWQDSFPHVCTFGRAAPLIGSFVVCGNHLTPPVYSASSVFGHQNLRQILKAPATITVPSGFHTFSLSNMSCRCDDDQGKRCLFFLWQQAFPFYSRTVLNCIL